MQNSQTSKWKWDKKRKIFSFKLYPFNIDVYFEIEIPHEHCQKLSTLSKFEKLGFA